MSPTSVQTYASKRKYKGMSVLRTIGSGLNVMEFKNQVEGKIRFLDSPEQVLDFIVGGTAEETIVLSRGGATTFIGPALGAGVRGLITLQGAPESHLGILSREFGIPCLMSVAFTEGELTERGEMIPIDGAHVILDASAPGVGHVLMHEGELTHD